MIVQKAENGWSGIFIPGDEALGLAGDLRSIADGLDEGTLSRKSIVAFLRHKATELQACREK